MANNLRYIYECGCIRKDFKFVDQRKKCPKHGEKLLHRMIYCSFCKQDKIIHIIGNAPEYCIECRPKAQEIEKKLKYDIWMKKRNAIAKKKAIKKAVKLKKSRLKKLALIKKQAAIVKRKLKKENKIKAEQNIKDAAKAKEVKKQEAIELKKNPFKCIEFKAWCGSCIKPCFPCLRYRVA